MDVLTVQKILFHGLLVVIMTAGLLAIMGLVQRRERALRIFCAYIIGVAFFEILTRYLSYQNMSTLRLIDYFNIHMLLWLSLFYYHLLIRNLSLKTKALVGTVMLITLAFGVFNHYLDWHILSNQSLVQFLFLVTSIWFLYYYLDIQGDKRLLKTLNFFNAGILVYCAASIFIAIFKEPISSLSLLTQKYIYVNVTAANLIAYILYMIGFIILLTPQRNTGEI